MKFKVGDRVVWRNYPKWAGIVLKVNPEGLTVLVQWDSIGPQRGIWQSQRKLMLYQQYRMEQYLGMRMRIEAEDEI